MAGICFYFEDNDVDVYSGRRIDFDAWNYAIKAAGDIDKAIIINKTNLDINSFDADMDIKILNNLPHLDNSVYVCCPWDGADKKIDIWHFDHNVEWYIFGPAHGWKKRLNFGLYVPMSGVAALHSVHIASVVLMHRYKVLSWQ